jgi:hypothetical protein
MSRRPRQQGHHCIPGVMFVPPSLKSLHSSSLNRVMCRQAPFYLQPKTDLCFKPCTKLHSRSNVFACPRRPSCCRTREATGDTDRANSVVASQTSLGVFHRSRFHRTCFAFRFAQFLRIPCLFHPSPQATRSPGLSPMSASGWCRSKWESIV